ncbi:MAG: four-carbon acid sugar kinase family protein [Geminicoccaceae bacterium]
MTTLLRLLADDLTGALDSAAAFAAPTAPVPIRWEPVAADAGSLALDSGTREASADAARDRVRRLAAMLRGREIDVAFKKIDSLLRGNEAVEIDTLLRELAPTHSILAPAFPAQGRVTRDGRQLHCVADGRWQPVSTDLVRELSALGHRVHRARPGDPLPSGLSVWDAESDEGLDAIVAVADGGQRPLWIGSGGLAAALARCFGRVYRIATPLPCPILGLFGSDHPVMREQLADVADRHETLGHAADTQRIAGRLRGEGVLMLSVAVATGSTRDAAARRIAGTFAALVRRLDPPGTLVASGGETLRGLCRALEATQLDAVGEVMPGIPCAILRGGRWDGTVVVSKSGAFGARDLLRRLLRPQEPEA